jgi:hypothetical protein
VSERVTLSLRVLEDRYAVCRFEPGTPVPAWAWQGSSFVTVTRTADELSVLCASSLVPDGVQAEHDWVCFKLEGPFAFTLTGILTSVLEPLRDAGVGIFAVSTFDTDYVLVKEQHFETSLRALEAWGHRVRH